MRGDARVLGLVLFEGQLVDRHHVEGGVLGDLHLDEGPHPGIPYNYIYSRREDIKVAII